MNGRGRGAGGVPGDVPVTHDPDGSLRSLKEIWRDYIQAPMRRADPADESGSVTVGDPGGFVLPTPEEAARDGLGVLTALEIREHPLYAHLVHEFNAIESGHLVGGTPWVD